MCYSLLCFFDSGSTRISRIRLRLQQSQENLTNFKSNSTILDIAKLEVLSGLLSKLLAQASRRLCTLHILCHYPMYHRCGHA